MDELSVGSRSRSTCGAQLAKASVVLTVAYEKAIEVDAYSLPQCV